MAQWPNYYSSVFFQLQVLKKYEDFTVTHWSVKQRICAMCPGGRWHIKACKSV